MEYDPNKIFEKGEKQEDKYVIKINKKLPIQLAVGVIVIIALIIGGSFYFSTKKNENLTLKQDHSVETQKSIEEKETIKEIEKEEIKPIGTVNLSGEKTSKGVKLKWNTENVNAPKGFKLVKAIGKDPVYPGDSYIYLSKEATRSYEWEIDNGKTYNFRVCVYTGESCSLYSNTVAVTAPKIVIEKDDEEQGIKISLFAKKDGDDVKLSWDISGGDAPKGFKVVKSKSKNPVYPGDDYKYLSDKKTDSYKWKDLKDGKTYHFRVCAYKGSGKCGTYSNDVEVKI